MKINGIEFRRDNTYKHGGINYNRADAEQPASAIIHAIGARFERNIGSLRFIRNPTGNHGMYGMACAEANFSEAAAMLGLLWDQGCISCAEEERLFTLLCNERDWTIAAIREREAAQQEPEPHGARDTFVPYPDGPDGEQFNPMQD